MEKKYNKLESFNKKVSKSVLSQTISDWQSCFINLKRYKGGQKLLMLAGPIVFGIELEKFFSDSYRPRIVMYNLIDNVSNKLITVVDQTIKDEKGLDITIKYIEHPSKYLEACNLLKQQAKIDLFEKPTIDEIINCIFSFIEENNIGNRFWSCQAIMQISRLIADKKKRESVFEKAFMLLQKNIPESLLETQTKGTIKWIEGIKSLTTEEIDTIVRANVQKYGF